MAAELDYTMLGTVENWIRSEGLRAAPAEYLDKVTVKLLIEPQDVEKIRTNLINLTAARCHITVAEPEYMAVPAEA